MASRLHVIAFSPGAASDWSTPMSWRSSGLAALGASAASAREGAPASWNRTVSSAAARVKLWILSVIKISFQVDLAISMSSQPPRFTERFGPQPVGFVIADEHVLDRIKLEFAPEEERDVGGVTGDVRLAGHIRVSARLAA